MDRSIRQTRAVTWEIVILVAVLAFLTRNPAGIAVGAVILLGVIIAAIPFGGLRLGERAARHRSFRRRSHTTPAQVPDEIGSVGAWLGDLAIHQTSSARGTDIGIVTDGLSWTAWLGLDSDDDLLAEHADVVDLDGLRGLTVQDDIIFESVQVITMVVPAPSAILVPEGSAANVSYRQLSADACWPSVKRTWIGVRLNPRLCLEAVTSRGVGRDGIFATMRFGLHRVRSVLKRQGISTTELTAPGITETMALLSGPGPVTESWRELTCNRLTHRSRGVANWGEGFSTAVDAIAVSPVLYGVASYTLNRHDAARGAIRVVTTDPDSADAAMRQIISSLGRAVALSPSGGDQAPGLLATVPLGRGMSR